MDTLKTKDLTNEDKADLELAKVELTALSKDYKEAQRTTKDVLKRVLKSDVAGFSEDQRAFFAEWWLEVDEKTLDTINSLMPPNNVVAPRVDTDGKLWINFDLFTDAWDGGRLASIIDILRDLKPVQKDAADWPVADDDDAKDAKDKK